MSLASLEQPHTVWNSSPEELGLTADQLQAEQKWIKTFNETGDELNWDKWQDYWSDDAFLVFSTKIRIEGKPALAQHFTTSIKLFKSAKHEVIRHSYDHARGLLYQKANLIQVVNGDPEGKAISTPVLTVFHRKVGESQVHGMEFYGDMTQLDDTIKAVLGKPT
ncbi:hypothetical protein FRC07_003441 [Ceratobasidium sp. 392]|nr:hypothetical protein FRC07_003441 [Ceratobasidium sp. 392]